MASKLNLGCGSSHLEGWCNVDCHAGCQPDVVHDLERTPWPFEADSADEILLQHVLEHLGRTPQAFLEVMRELWRVSRNGALIRIRVPHPLHQDFRTDPTHVRAISPEMLAMFNREECDWWQRSGLSNTPLALICGVDFVVETTNDFVDETTRQKLAAKGIEISMDEVLEYRGIFLGLIKEIEILLRVRKA